MKKDRYECFYLAIFAPDMKRLRYILAVLLSLTVVYAGAGVSIVHYCCARCETAQACCTNGCAKCHKSHKTSHKPEKSCKDEGCTATFYKVDLVKYSCESPVITVPVIQLFCEVLPDFQYSLPTRELKEASYVESISVQEKCFPSCPVLSKAISELCLVRSLSVSKSTEMIPLHVLF